jgi:hypothetical protein
LTQQKNPSTIDRSIEEEEKINDSEFFLLRLIEIIFSVAKKRKKLPLHCKNFFSRFQETVIVLLVLKPTTFISAFNYDYLLQECRLEKEDKTETLGQVRSGTHRCCLVQACWSKSSPGIKSLAAETL